MPIETITEPVETSKEPQYTYKSFQLVFSSFCSQYEKSLGSLTMHPSRNGNSEGFMGLPPKASVQQMGRRLNETAQAMGDPPGWEDDQQEGATMKEAVLLSARYLAWHATRGAITQQYVDRLREYIDRERPTKSLNGGSRHNIGRLNYERDNGLVALLAQNHALRDYFDSGLAQTLRNDSPERMSHLLNNVPYLRDRHREDLVAGISLEIASKRYLETLINTHKLGDLEVAYGSDEQDPRGGDLVVLKEKEIMFIDVKSSMPARFADGEPSTPQDYERGYKWVVNDDKEHKVVVWAYQVKPIESGQFRLADARLANSLELVASSMNS